MVTKQQLLVDGIFLLDKATGITSNKALQQIKRIFNAKKAGHTGSLDPLATGVLPICFGEGTKFASYLLAADKHYQVTAKLGITTDTGDADGKILATTPLPSDYNRENLQAILARFCGEIAQLPPMYSALKHQGQPLYKLARKGIVIERQPRLITIYQIKLVSMQAEYITLQVHCSKGTYIRTLIEDLGTVLGCGAHVVSLRRLQLGNYKETEAMTIEALVTCLAKKQKPPEDLLLSIDSALVTLPTMLVSELTATNLIHGKQVIVTKPEHYGLVKLYINSNGKFLGIGEVMNNGMIISKRLINTTKLI